MQDPNEDTDWNEILRSKGILPPKVPEFTDEQLEEMVEEVIKKNTQEHKDYEEMNLDELDEFEDEEDDRILLEYKLKRLAELKGQSQSAYFGSVGEITKPDFIQEVTNARKDLPVVCLLYNNAIPICKLIMKHLDFIANKYPTVKFVKIIGSNCIENYPDRNLPTVFIYKNSELLAQHVGPFIWGGMKMTCDEVEWILSKSGAFETDLEEDPRENHKIDDVISRTMKNLVNDDF